MMTTLRISIAGLTRELPIIEIAPGVRIAFFQLLGDPELCERVAGDLYTRVHARCDYILTAETKSIPLAHELSKLAGKPYVVARKTHKPYLQNPISEPVRSFTSSDMRSLFL